MKRVSKHRLVKIAIEFDIKYAVGFTYNMGHLEILYQNKLIYREH